MLRIKRAYAEPEESDGTRILVDRIWPRGLSKEDLQLDGWLKQVAPSDDLRKWFDHDPDKWQEFRSKYRQELIKKSETWKPIIEKASDGEVTLVYGSKEEEYNNAVVLKEFLKERL